MTFKDDVFFIGERDPWTVAHYILYRSGVANIANTVQDGRVVLTPEGNTTFLRFVKVAVEAYNDTHDTQLGVESIIDLVKSIAKNDSDDIKRILTIPK